MRVGLTGATGFLGLHLVPGLIDRFGDLVVLAHRGSAPALPRITSFLRMAGFDGKEIRRLTGQIQLIDIEATAPGLGLAPADFAALAAGLDAIWHSAGTIHLQQELPAARAVNVGGVRGVLELATARPEMAVHHISTAFVAGARRTGVIAEGQLSDEADFENPYERSKYEAELLIRRWAARHGRAAWVFRPSVLVSPLPAHPDLPRHPLRVIVELLEMAARACGRPSVARMPGDPAAHLNLMPAADAAAMMLELASTPPRAVDTRHVVHHHDVTAPELLELYERATSVRYELVPEAPAEPTAMESLIALYPGFLCYLKHRREFATASRASGTAVDVDYLLRGVTSPLAAVR